MSIGPSPHSMVVGGYRRGAPTGLIRVRRDMNDPVVARFFEEIDRRVVGPHIIQDTSTVRAKRADRFRTGPILRIAEELGLFDHIESKGVRGSLFPTYPDFRVARANDEVTATRDPSKKLGYSLDENGDCRFTFREWTEGTGNHGGARSRGYGSRDASDKDRAGDTLEPQVNLRQIDPSTGVAIDDKRVDGVWQAKADRQPGNWRAEMVTLPLVTPIRELKAGDATYPIERGVFSNLMNSQERAAAGYSS